MRLVHCSLANLLAPVVLKAIKVDYYHLFNLKGCKENDFARICTLIANPTFVRLRESLQCLVIEALGHPAGEYESERSLYDQKDDISGDGISVTECPEVGVSTFHSEAILGMLLQCLPNLKTIEFSGTYQDLGFNEKRFQFLVRTVKEWKAEKSYRQFHVELHDITDNFQCVNVVEQVDDFYLQTYFHVSSSKDIKASALARMACRNSTLVKLELACNISLGMILDNIADGSTISIRILRLSFPGRIYPKPYSRKSLDYASLRKMPYLEDVKVDSGFQVEPNLWESFGKSEIRLSSLSVDMISHDLLCYLTLPNANNRLKNLTVGIFHYPSKMPETLSILEDFCERGLPSISGTLQKLSFCRPSWVRRNVIDVQQHIFPLMAKHKVILPHLRCFQHPVIPVDMNTESSESATQPDDTFSPDKVFALYQHWPNLNILSINFKMKSNKNKIVSNEELIDTFLSKFQGQHQENAKIPIRAVLRIKVVCEDQRRRATYMLNSNHEWRPSF